MLSKLPRLLARFNAIHLLFIFVLSTVISTLSPFPVNAFDQTFYSYNDILYYNKDACSSSRGGGSEDTQEKSNKPAATFGKSDLLEKIYKQLVSYKFNRGQIAAIMGNMYGESNFKPDIEESNSIGYGLAQWSFGRRTNLEAYAKSKGVAVSDPTIQIEWLNKEYNDTYKSTLESTPFQKGSDIEASTRAWMEVFEVPYIDPASSDPARINSVRIPGALRIDELYGELGEGSVNNLASCSSGDGVAAGDIVKTAINFALQTPISAAESDAGTKTQKKDARAEYQVGKEKYNPPKANGVPSWSDCGGYVATVMIATGVDKDFPAVGVTDQMRYVANHPEKYFVTTTIKSVTDLQPGDLLYVNNNQYAHVVIYTGDNTYPSVDASLNQRVPGVRPTEAGAKWMLQQSGVTVVRVTK